MRPSFQPRLVNDPFGDPALFIPFLFQRRAFLFDLGDLTPLGSRDILKVTHVFVTHTHMDHFVGFDQMLRLFLGRNKQLHLFGPPGFFRNIEGKLAGYTWNLVQNYAYPFSLMATEVSPKSMRTRRYRCGDGFRHKETVETSFNGTLVSDDAFTIQTVLLDHKIPCLAFKLKERFHVNIMKDHLSPLGLSVGPWLHRFKQTLYEEKDRENVFTVSWKESGKEKTRNFVLGDLAEAISKITPGQQIVYVVDVGYTPDNVEKIISFAKDADQLFIEGAFLEKDAEIASRKYHLTAKQAGTLARKAHVKHFTLLHHSPKYQDTPHLFQQEAMQAFEE